MLASAASPPPSASLAEVDYATLFKICVIWSLVGLNFTVLAVLRPLQEHWHPASVGVGYAGLVLQIVAFYRCRYTDPGTVSAEWVANAAAGRVPASVCQRSGKLVPPRGLYVRRWGGRVVLGFDHYCFWLGAPIGLYNRRHFILFVLYTALMAAIAAFHLAYELLAALPARVGHDLQAMARLAAQPDAEFSPWRRQSLERLAAPGAWAAWAATPSWGAWALRPMEASLVWSLELLAAAHGHGRLGYLVLVLAALVTDVASAFLVGHQAAYHLLLVRRGRTTLVPHDDAYDAGRRTNWEQVFGTSRLWWFAPMRGTGPACDGYTWPEAREEESARGRAWPTEAAGAARSARPRRSKVVGRLMRGGL